MCDSVYNIPICRSLNSFKAVNTLVIIVKDQSARLGISTMHKVTNLRNLNSIGSRGCEIIKEEKNQTSYLLSDA